MAKVFQATFKSGLCPECGDPIEKGDDVSYSGPELLHAECNYQSNYDEAYYFDAEFDLNSENGDW